MRRSMQRIRASSCDSARKGEHVLRRAFGSRASSRLSFAGSDRARERFTTVIAQFILFRFKLREESESEPESKAEKEGEGERVAVSACVRRSNNRGRVESRVTNALDKVVGQSLRQPHAAGALVQLELALLGDERGLGAGSHGLHLLLDLLEHERELVQSGLSFLLLDLEDEVERSVSVDDERASDDELPSSP